MWAFELIDVEVQFDNGRVLRGLNVGGRQGRVTAVAGGPGTGKTTVFELLGGERRPREGAALVGGRDISRARGRTLKHLRRGIGMLADGAAGERMLTLHLSARENVELAVHRSRRITTREAAALARRELDRMDLLPVADAPVASLGAGKRRRLAFATLLAARPPLVLVDGFDWGLDRLTVEDVAAAVADHVAHHRTAWLVTTGDAEVAALAGDDIELLGGVRPRSSARPR